MNTRPLRSEVENRIRSAKAAYTAACAAVLANRPNAATHAELALRRLNEARRQLAAIDSEVNA